MAPKSGPKRGPKSRPKRIGNAFRGAAVIAAIAIASALAPLAAKADPLAIEHPAAEARVVKVGNYSLWPWACPVGTHYTCWHGATGGRYCGCWVGGDRPACPTGYYYTCRPDPFGNPYCACY